MTDVGDVDVGDVGYPKLRFMLLLLLMSYHRRLRMISEKLQPREEGGRVSHSWCMCVISHVYGEFGWGWDGGGGW